MLLIPKNSQLIGQGLTGSEGQTSLPLMLSYGTKIVAGVTPGKEGMIVAGVPIFNTVKGALEKFPGVIGSVQFVPPLFTKNAVLESLEAGLKFILIGAEKVPTKDSAIIYAASKKYGATVLGPSSVGLISPHERIKIGPIGGANPDRSFVDGEIAVISKSGGMTSEIGVLLKNHGLGVSWAAGIGGDRIISTDFADFLLELENDERTKASVIFGELGGTYEERVAKLVKEGKIVKPVVAFIAGEFTASLPSEVQFGHAGAIIEGTRGLPSTKRKILSESGVLVASSFDEIPNLLKQVINK